MTLYWHNKRILYPEEFLWVVVLDWCHAWRAEAQALRRL
jgi:hypothetical protein